MTNFKNAFYGLNKTDSNELNDIINNVDTLNDNLESYITETELSTALADYVETTALTTALSSYTTSAALTTTLADYVTGTTLTTNLANYAKIVTAPVSATSAGNVGEIAFDATNIYVCIAASTWVKATLATWT